MPAPLHDKKAHTHPTVDEYYDEIRRKLDEHPEYFSPEISARYLITGLAGSGKTTLRKEFAKKGYITIDIDEGYAEWRHTETDEVLDYTPDDPAWHEVAGWVVKTDKLQEFFDTHPDEIVLVFGSFARIKTVVGMFDKIILLEYPNSETARERIASREGGYGKHPHELARILSYIEPYQQKMKSHGAISISCTLPIAKSIEVIEQVIHE
jgi:adenylate kinase family enzyme